MFSAATFSILRLSLLGIILGLMLTKHWVLRRYNRQSEEPAGFNGIGRFSMVEIDGSYTADRRRALQLCNRLTNLMYLCMALMVVSFVVQMMAKQLGL